MKIKRILAVFFVLSYIAGWSGSALAQGRAVRPENAQPQVNIPEETFPAKPTIQPESAPAAGNWPQPYGVSPNIGQEQGLCKPAVVTVVHCQPQPGSPLSAFPLVFNTHQASSSLAAG
jgi:hypothetical protein